MVEVENERRRQVEEDEQRAREAFEEIDVGVGGARQQTGAAARQCLTCTVVNSKRYLTCRKWFLALVPRQ